MQPRYTATAVFAGTPDGGLVLPAPPASALVLTLMPFFKGDKGDPGGITEEQLMEQITQGIAAQTYDFDAIVAANLSI